jgi:7-carboxy-7-deazaguanine synthase
MISMDSTELIPVNEIFGPTFQGEGKYTGQRCVFIRFAKCNQTCFFCDTPYTWAFTERKAELHRDRRQYSREAEIHERTIRDVVDTAFSLCTGATDIAVLSGGEPLLYTHPIKEKDRLGQIAYDLGNLGIRIHIETAGTLPPGNLLVQNVEHFVVSPKLESSGNKFSIRYKPTVLKQFAELGDQTTFKFVVVAMLDLEEIAHIVEDIGIDPANVMLMPEAINAGALAMHSPWVAEAALQAGYGFSTRLHIALWEEARGH